MTSMVDCVLRTEHPCPEPDDVHGRLRFENGQRWSQQQQQFSSLATVTPTTTPSALTLVGYVCMGTTRYVG